MRDERAEFRRNTIALVPHDDDAVLLVGQCGFFVDVPAVEESAVDRKWKIRGGQFSGQVNIINVHAGEGAHSGLNNFGAPAVSSFAGAEDMMHSEPICGSNDGAEVTGVLYSIEGQDEFGRSQLSQRNLFFIGLTEHGYHTLRGAQLGHLLQLQGRSVSGIGTQYQRKLTHEFADTFFPFCQEDMRLVSLLFSPQTTDEFDLIFSNSFHN